MYSLGDRSVQNISPSQATSTPIKMGFIRQDLRDAERLLPVVWLGADHRLGRWGLGSGGFNGQNSDQLGEIC